MIELYSFNIEDKEISREQYERFLSLISEEKRERINKFKRHEDKLRSLFGEVITRIEISKKLLCKFSEINFKKNEYGKLSADKNIYFNISHSGKFVIVGISDNEIGVDIEKYRDESHKIIELAKRYYTKQEYEYVLSFSSDEERVKAFYKLWTLKESYVKYIGKGLSIPLSSFAFEFKEDCIKVSKDDRYIENIRLENYNVEDSYMLSVCSDKSSYDDKVQIYNLTLDDLIEYFK